MVRAFRSTLDELEDKRSVHSAQGLMAAAAAVHHGLRVSRSHPRDRPLAEELRYPTDISAKTPSPGGAAAPGLHPEVLNGAYEYTNMGLVIVPGDPSSSREESRRASSKSRSAENVALLLDCGSGSGLSGGVHNPAKSPSVSNRTMSSNDISLHCWETAM